MTMSLNGHTWLITSSVANEFTDFVLLGTMCDCSMRQKRIRISSTE